MKRLEHLRGRASALWRCEAGATAIEYALIAGSLSIVISAAVLAIGESLQETFEEIAEFFDE